MRLRYLPIFLMTAAMLCAAGSGNDAFAGYHLKDFRIPKTSEELSKIYNPFTIHQTTFDTGPSEKEIVSITGKEIALAIGKKRVQAVFLSGKKSQIMIGDELFEEGSLIQFPDAEGNMFPLIGSKGDTSVKVVEVTASQITVEISQMGRPSFKAYVRFPELYKQSYRRN